ncbi:MAG: hypothetical protein NTV34_07145 [Proteobacteria bacterium]|nr:hypothetical protein [Pseudomonadota bacterium]
MNFSGMLTKYSIFAALITAFSCRSTASLDQVKDTNAGGSSPHADYLKMKLFRTYFTAASTSPLRKHFGITYDYGSTKNLYAMYVVTDDADLKKIAKLPINVESVFRNHTPGSEGVVVPSELLPASGAIEQDIKESGGAPGPRVTEVRYLGEFYDVDFKEIIPLSSRSNSESALAGIAPFCPTSLSESCKAKPVLIDFSMPEALEGRAPVSAARYAASSTASVYEPIKSDIERKLFLTLKELANGSYSSPLGAILARQGASLLPQKSPHTLSLSFASYFDNGPGTAVLSGKNLLGFNVSQSLAKDVEATSKIESSNGVISATLNLNAKTLVVTLSHDDGARQTKSYKLRPFDVIHDGAADFIRQGYVSFDNTEASDRMPTVFKLGNTNSLRGTLSGELEMAPY